MPLLLLLAFAAGVVTVVSPCVLPVLPLVLGGAQGGGRLRPLGIGLGVAASFTAFTVALTGALEAVGVSATVQRDLAVTLLIGIGVALLVPGADRWLALPFRPLERAGLRLARGRGRGLGGGLVLGAALGLVWTPCAGPILAAAAAAGATGRSEGQAALVVAAYAVGAAAPLFGLAVAGRGLVARLGPRAGAIRRGMGAAMAAAGVLVLLGLDTRITAALVDRGGGYVDALQSIERAGAIEYDLARLRGNRPEDVRLAVALAGADLPLGPMAPEVRGIRAWLNTPGGRPLPLARLRGRVVLVDFWTYSCVNCVRTIPHLQALDRAYRRHGLTILGVHTPEFAFERDPGNVARAVRGLGVTWPVALDDRYATWDAFANQVWPAEYLVDRRGRLRHLQLGEGDERQTEASVRRLLGLDGPPRVARRRPTDRPPRLLTTPESYLGFERLRRYAGPVPVVRGGPAAYRAPRRLGRDRVAFTGRWTLRREAAEASGPGAAVDLRFFARRVFLVLAPAGGRGEGRVLLDGRPVAPGAAGRDVGPGGRLRVRASRLYALVDLPQAGEHVLRVHLAPGTRAFAFTFG